MIRQLTFNEIDNTRTAGGAHGISTFALAQWTEELVPIREMLSLSPLQRQSQAENAFGARRSDADPSSGSDNTRRASLSERTECSESDDVAAAIRRLS